MWRVRGWSSHEGKGELVGELGALPLSRAQALVEDFFPDEEVEAVLEEESGVLVARDVAPVAWRENALTLPDADERFRAPMSELSSVLGPHARVQLAGAVEDVLSLEVHDVDWPPPVTPPLARVRFDGAQYFKMPTYSEEFVVARAFPFRAWASLRGTVLRSWSLSRELASSDAVLFRFEPARFGASAGYVVATGVEVSVPKPR